MKINQSNLNLNSNSNEWTVHNNISEPASPDTTIGFMSNGIYCGYRGKGLIVQLHHSTDARDFISQPLIRRHQFYLWCRHVLDKSGINTRFEEHNQSTFISVWIKRAIWRERVAELTNTFGANRGLTGVTEKTFHLPTRMNYNHIWAISDVCEPNNTDNTSQGYASSYYMTENLDTHQHVSTNYRPSMSRASTESNATYSGHNSPPHLLSSSSSGQEYKISF